MKFDEERRQWVQPRRDRGAGWFLIWFGFVTLLSLGFLGVVVWAIIEVVSWLTAQ